MAVQTPSRTRRTRISSSQRRRRVARARSTTVRRHTASGALPEWRDLHTRNRKRKTETAPIPFLATVSLYRVVLWIVGVGIVLTLYIGHVLATADTLNALRQERARNLSLHLQLNRLQGIYDQHTGPVVIYRRAEALGLEQGLAYGPTIYLNW